MRGWGTHVTWYQGGSSSSSTPSTRPQKYLDLDGSSSSSNHCRASRPGFHVSWGACCHEARWAEHAVQDPRRAPRRMHRPARVGHQSVGEGTCCAPTRVAEPPTAFTFSTVQPTRSSGSTAATSDTCACGGGSGGACCAPANGGSGPSFRPPGWLGSVPSTCPSVHRSFVPGGLR